MVHAFSAEGIGTGSVYVQCKIAKGEAVEGEVKETVEWLEPAGGPTGLDSKAAADRGSGQVQLLVAAPAEYDHRRLVPSLAAAVDAAWSRQEDRDSRGHAMGRQLPRLISQSSLVCELIPAGCYGSDVRSLVTQEAWTYLRSITLEAAGHRCETCGYGPPEENRDELECHEVWFYHIRPHEERPTGGPSIARRSSARRSIDRYFSTFGRGLTALRAWLRQPGACSASRDRVPARDEEEPGSEGLRFGDRNAGHWDAGAQEAERGIQRLERLACRCFACHAVSHADLTISRTAMTRTGSGPGRALVARHLSVVNGWSMARAERHIREALRERSERSRVKWDLDVRLLIEYGLRACNFMPGGVEP